MKKHFILITGFLIILVLGWGLRILSLDPQIILSGVVNTVDKPIKTVSSLMNGTYQSAKQLLFSTNFPLRNVYIKLHNQLIYSIFHQSPNDNIVIGNNNNLFEKHYINDYFHTTGDKYIEINQLVQDLQFVQQELTERNKKVVVIITPSKADFFANDIPNKYRLLKSDKKRNYDILLDNFVKYNINYFDSFSYLQSIKNSFEVPFFQRTGTHWNYVAAAISAEKLCNYLDDIYGYKNQFSNIKTVGYKRVNMPLVPDQDIYYLMNTIKHISSLNYKDEIYYEPCIDADFTPGVLPCKMFIQGGSFQHEIIYALSKNNKNQISYLQNKQVSIFNGSTYFIDKITDFDIDQIIDSDVFIFEVNVAAANNMGFGFIQFFKEYLQTHELKKAEPLDNVFCAKKDIYPERSYGFYQDEGTFRWSHKTCGVLVENDKITENGLQIEFTCIKEYLLQSLKGTEPTINVYVNGQIIKQNERLLEGYQKIILQNNLLPLASDDIYFVEIECNGTFIPNEIIKNGDTRSLALQIHYIGDAK